MQDPNDKGYSGSEAQNIQEYSSKSGEYLGCTIKTDCPQPESDKQAVEADNTLTAEEAALILKKIIAPWMDDPDHDCPECKELRPLRAKLEKIAKGRGITPTSSYFDQNGVLDDYETMEWEEWIVKYPQYLNYNDEGFCIIMPIHQIVKLLKAKYLPESAKQEEAV
jgi:hypothetical protein